MSPWFCVLLWISLTGAQVITHPQCAFRANSYDGTLFNVYSCLLLDCEGKTLGVSVCLNIVGWTYLGLGTLRSLFWTGFLSFLSHETDDFGLALVWLGSFVLPFVYNFLTLEGVCVPSFTQDGGPPGSGTYCSSCRCYENSYPNPSNPTRCTCNPGWVGVGGRCEGNHALGILVSQHPLAQNKCEEANGGCQDVCTPTGPGSRACSCRDPNMILVGKECVCNPPEDWNQYGTTCYRMWWMLHVHWPFVAQNLCIEDNGGCEDYCHFTGPGSRTCLCLDPNARKDGVTQCACNPGYEEIGKTCLRTFSSDIRC